MIYSDVYFVSELWWWHNADTFEIPGDAISFSLTISSTRINQPGQDDSNDEHADALDTVPFEAVCPECLHPVYPAHETPGPGLSHALAAGEKWLRLFGSQSEICWLDILEENGVKMGFRFCLSMSIFYTDGFE